MNEEKVDHPRHYNAHPSGVECIDVVEHMGFNLGNAVKYVWRAGLKGVPSCGADCERNADEHAREKVDATLEDLRKAIWYLKREVHRLEKGLSK